MITLEKLDEASKVGHSVEMAYPDGSKNTGVITEIKPLNDGIQFIIKRDDDVIFTHWVRNKEEVALDWSKAPPEVREKLNKP